MPAAATELYEVVNGAYGYPNCEVAVVPLGSGNDFVHLFGTRGSSCNVEAQVRVRPRRSLMLSGRGDKIAIFQCSMGMDAGGLREAVLFQRRCRL